MHPITPVPGRFVRHPAEPDRGIGQVQPVIGDRIAVNFEHAGKRLVNAALGDRQTKAVASRRSADS
jgi:hypothetical protein